MWYAAQAANPRYSIFGGPSYCLAFFSVNVCFQSCRKIMRFGCKGINDYGIYTVVHFIGSDYKTRTCFLYFASHSGIKFCLINLVLFYRHYHSHSNLSLMPNALMMESRKHIPLPPVMGITSNTILPPWFYWFLYCYYNISFGLRQCLEPQYLAP